MVTVRVEHFVQATRLDLPEVGGGSRGRWREVNDFCCEKTEPFESFGIDLSGTNEVFPRLLVDGGRSTRS